MEVTPESVKREVIFDYKTYVKEAVKRLVHEAVCFSPEDLEKLLPEEGKSSPPSLKKSFNDWLEMVIIDEETAAKISDELQPVGGNGIQRGLDFRQASLCENLAKYAPFAQRLSSLIVARAKLEAAADLATGVYPLLLDEANAIKKLLDDQIEEIIRVKQPGTLMELTAEHDPIIYINGRAVPYFIVMASLLLSGCQVGIIAGVDVVDPNIPRPPATLVVPSATPTEKPAVIATNTSRPTGTPIATSTPRPSPTPSATAMPTETATTEAAYVYPERPPVQETWAGEPNFWINPANTVEGIMLKPEAGEMLMRVFLDKLNRNADADLNRTILETVYPDGTTKINADIDDIAAYLVITNGVLPPLGFPTRWDSTREGSMSVSVDGLEVIDLKKPIELQLYDESNPMPEEYLMECIGYMPDTSLKTFAMWYLKPDGSLVIRIHSSVWDGDSYEIWGYSPSAKIMFLFTLLALGNEGTEALRTASGQLPEYLTRSNTIFTLIE